MGDCMNEQFSRTEMIIGTEKLKKLKNSAVIVFGVGGVGGAVTEALARSGIGRIAVVDKDIVEASNINRQAVANYETVGRKKTDVAEELIKRLNPQAIVEKYDMFYLPETADAISLENYDFIVDAIDNVTAKIELIVRADSSGVPIISSMGTGNKLYPELFEIGDIYSTSVCPLAKIMRKELKNRGIKKLPVLYSKEIPVKTGSSVCGSMPFTPPVAGYIMAGYVIRKITET